MPNEKQKKTDFPKMRDISISLKNQKKETKEKKKSLNDWSWCSNCLSFVKNRVFVYLISCDLFQHPSFKINDKSKKPNQSLLIWNSMLMMILYDMSFYGIVLFFCHHNIVFLSISFIRKKRAYEQRKVKSYNQNSEYKTYSEKKTFFYFLRNDVRITDGYCSTENISPSTKKNWARKKRKIWIWQSVGFKSMRNWVAFRVWTIMHRMCSTIIHPFVDAIFFQHSSNSVFIGFAFFRILYKYE